MGSPEAAKSNPSQEETKDTPIILLNNLRMVGDMQLVKKEYAKKKTELDFQNCLKDIFHLPEVSESPLSHAMQAYKYKIETFTKEMIKKHAKDIAVYASILYTFII